MPRCRKCRDTILHVGKNWAKSRSEHQDYICNSCTSIYFNNYRQNPKYRETAKRSGKKWLVKNKERVKARTLLKSHGLSFSEYDDIWIEQIGLCAVCSKSEGDIPFFVDHDHKSGKIRGLLHRNCNAALGFLCDDPLACERAASYLRSF